MGNGLFVWSRGRGGKDHEDTALFERTYGECSLPFARGPQKTLGMVPGKRYRLTAEEAPRPEPCPEPKGEMVVKVLTVHDNPSAWGYHITTPGACLEPHAENVRMVGIYRVPDSVLDEDRGGGLAEALKAIRDGGGEWLAGAELPEKVVETFPWIRRPDKGYDHVHHCSQCLYTSSDPQDGPCPGCGDPLSGVIPWDPTAYKNKGC